jgi:hypothetical protein
MHEQGGLGRESVLDVGSGRVTRAGM